jgi:hypothetical protein
MDARAASTRSRGSRGARRFAAALLVVAFAAAAAAPATQVHLSYGDAPDEMRVLWATDSPTRTSVVEFTRAVDGAAATALSRRVLAAAGSPLVAPTATRVVAGEQWRFAASPTRNISLHNVRTSVRVTSCLR